MSSNRIANLIDAKSGDENIAMQIASYLIESKQTLQLDSLMRDVMTTRELRGIYEIDVISAHPLSPDQIESVKTLIKSFFKDCKEVIMHQKVDPNVLGGLRIESANYLVDKTLKSKLNYIRSSIGK